MPVCSQVGRPALGCHVVGVAPCHGEHHALSASSVGT